MNQPAAFPRVLRAAALVAVVTGAIGTFALMVRVGHRNRSLFLIAAFTIWDLAPFVALVVADWRSKRWSAATRTTLHAVMLIVAVGSVTIYARVAFGPPKPQPAFWFLVAPVASWLLMTLVAIAAWRARAET